MTGALHDALARALKHKKVSAAKRGLLPRGTNQREARVFKTLPVATHREVSNRGGRYLGDFKVDVNLPSNDHSPEYREGLRRSMLGLSHTVVEEAILNSRKVQTVVGQAANVESHMMMTKPVDHRYPEPDPARDYSMDWKRSSHYNKPKVDANLARLRADRELRNRIQALVNNEECE